MKEIFRKPIQLICEKRFLTQRQVFENIKKKIKTKILKNIKTLEMWKEIENGDHSR